MEVVREFLKDHGSDKGVGDVQFVIGEFSDFPIDYYAANLIVCIDNLSFIESSSAIDEFRRALQFDGVLYMASPVLSDDDENAVMDEYLRRMFPLHNEYYMPEELKTVLGLNEFRFIKGSLVKFPESVRDQTAFFSGLYGGHEKDCLEFLEGNSEAVSGFYDYSEGRFSMPYYSGVFMRSKADYVFEKK
jgi:hypothetical protein